MFAKRKIMSLRSAIEHIRQQPEAIRLRYLFLFVGISFTSIVTLWMFSLQESFKEVAGKTTTQSITQKIQTVNTEAMKTAPDSLESLIQSGQKLQEIQEAVRQETMVVEPQPFLGEGRNQKSDKPFVPQENDVSPQAPLSEALNPTP